MKTFRLIGMLLIVLVTTTFPTSCSDEYDDSLLTNRVDDLENRVSKLEELCSQMNTNIGSLQTLINALQERDYITNVTPITKEEKTIGYTITFAKSSPITIYHGKDGENGKDDVDGNDGSTPIIGVKKHTDDIYYWTINNKWLLDDAGNKIKAEGKDGSNGSNGSNGANGNDGITPKLKIENGYWYVSYDNGSTWTELGKATGEDGENGDNIFLSVTQDENNVYFKLVNGTTITISKNSSSNPKPTDYIQFEDVNVKVLCLKWDTNYDGELSYEEAANVTSLGATFNDNNSIRLFKELQYFTGLNSIESAFFSCDNLTYIKIPSNVVNIDNAFYGCLSLRSIDIPFGVVSFGDDAFMNCLNLTNVIIPSSVTAIGNYAFSGCKSLTTIAIPNSVTTIGDGAFSGIMFETINIPNNVTTIGVNAFAGSNLTKVTIPENVTLIGNGAFSNCSSLKEIYCRATTPPTISNSSLLFSPLGNHLTIYVPNESLDNYKSNWSKYSSYIQGYSFTK